MLKMPKFNLILVILNKFGLLFSSVTSLQRMAFLLTIEVKTYIIIAVLLYNKDERHNRY